MIKDKRICNYHTHTLYCGHGIGYPIDYLKVAIKNNFQVLGFSEHAPLPEKYFIHTIDEKENEYFEKVTALKNNNFGIKIYVGLEIDYFEEFNDFYKKLLNKYDYLSLSCHYIKYQAANIGDYSCFNLNTTEKKLLFKKIIFSGIHSQLFSYLNHPDIFINDNDELIRKISEDIIDEAIKYDLPLELNISQMLRFPLLYKQNNIRFNFWKKVSQKQAKVIINFDAHQPNLLNIANYKKALLFANNLNLNMIEKIIFKGKN